MIWQDFKWGRSWQGVAYSSLFLFSCGYLIGGKWGFTLFWMMQILLDIPLWSIWPFWALQMAPGWLQGFPVGRKVPGVSSLGPQEGNKKSGYKVFLRLIRIYLLVTLNEQGTMISID